MSFHVFTFAGSQGRCLNTRSSGRVFVHILRDPTKVQPIKKHLLSLFLHILPDSNQNSKNIKLYFFSFSAFLCNNIVIYKF